MTIRGLLFDLDGTLADTAPDLVAALNGFLRDRGEPPIPYAIARNEVSNGALGLLRLGLKLEADATVDERHRDEFLTRYATSICDGSRLFLKTEWLDELCARHGAFWGIVTNKPERFTMPLLEALRATAAGCIVSGDTLAQRKPHPAPLLHAASLLGLEPGACVYVGDSSRDIAAGNAAGMQTIAAGYGYIRLGDSIEDWGAHRTARNPAGLLTALATLLDRRAAP